MDHFRQQKAAEFALHTETRSRGNDEPDRWTEYLGSDMTYPTTSRPSRNRTLGTSGNAASKGMSLQWVFQLSEVADGLMSKIYKFNQILDHPDPVGNVYSEAFWRAGIFPNSPRLCVQLSKKFPDHFTKMQLDRVDKASLDALIDGAEVYLQNLEPYVQFLLDLMLFREQALRLILDLSSTIITLLPHQNSLILHAFMDLFCSFVRVNLLSEKFPRKMVVQTFNLLYSLSRNDRDCDFYHRLVQFIDSYDPPLKGLQEDLNFVSPRIGEVLEAVGPLIFLSADTKKLRNEGFLSPYHPRYPDILTNSAHPMRAQDLAHVTLYREWVILGYLVCPDELLRVTSIDIALVVLKENLIIPLFRDEYALLHENYQHYVLPRILESKKMAKSGRSKQKEADLEYSVAKQVEKMISEVHDQALQYCDAIHLERRILLKQEVGRMVLFFTDQPSLLAPNIHMVFSALALAQSEVLWYFQHVGSPSFKSKTARAVPVEIDAGDSTIGFLLDGMDRLCCLVRKYISAIRGYALSFLTSCAGRIRFLLGTPGMIALDLDVKMKGLFQEIIRHLEAIPKPQSENVSRVNCDLSDFRKDWSSLLMIVTSSRSAINIRHLEKATISTGKEGLLSEGNAAFSWSRCVDELELQLCKHGSFKKLYFYHHHLTTVFKNTMFGPEGRPQHCCAWLGVASSFPESASAVISEEAAKIGRDSVIYVESLIESIMGGLEGLINILDSDAGFGALESQLVPEQAAFYFNNVGRSTNPSTRSPKGSFSLPGNESFPENMDSVKMLEAAMQRLTNLCSVLNEMEPICVLNNVFVLREYMRECILGNFKRRLLAVIKNENDIQRPSVIESLIRKHMIIIHLAEQHVSMDLTLGAREILLSEAFTGPVDSLQLFDKSNNQVTGSATDLICNWYVDNIVKDVSGCGIVFAPIHKCYQSTRPVGGYSADSVADQTEVKSFVRLFGMYGVDKLRRMLKEHTAALVNCIYSSLRSNHEVLEAVASSMHSGDRIEREASCRQIVDLETVMGFCIEAGQALAFNQLLSEACGAVLEENALLIHSLLEGVVDHLPKSIPEKKEVTRMKVVASTVGLSKECDSLWILSILKDASGANSTSWELLPYMFASFMSSNVWMNTVFKVNSGGFTNNMHCLGRCISGLIAGSETVRLEQECRISSTDVFDEMQGNVSAEISVKSAMLLFIKFAALISLDSLNDVDVNRSQIVSKLIFLDQLCEFSPYLPRSTMEAHVPYEILRSIYSQYYSASPTLSLSLSLPAASPIQTAAIFASPIVKPSPQISLNVNKSTAVPENLYDGEGGTSRTGQVRQKNVPLSGPLDYSSSRKVKFAETSTSASTASRFAVSRSGPLLYKLNSRT